VQAFLFKEVRGPPGELTRTFSEKGRVVEVNLAPVTSLFRLWPFHHRFSLIITDFGEDDFRH